MRPATRGQADAPSRPIRPQVGEAAVPRQPLIPSMQAECLLQSFL